MTYRVQVDAAFLRTGYVEIEADTPEQAAATVRRLGRHGATALNIQWTGGTRQGPVKAGDAEQV